MKIEEIMARALCIHEEEDEAADDVVDACWNLYIREVKAILSALKEAGFVVVPVELLKRCERELRYVVDDIENDRVSIDGDAFHETLQDICAMIAAQEEK